MARIQINALRVATVIGVYAVERTAPQIIQVDLSFDVDTSRAETQDTLSDTVDYAAVANTVREVASASSFQLVEALGQAILASVQSTFSVTQLTITLTKFGCIPSADGVSITLTQR